MNATTPASPNRIGRIDIDQGGIVRYRPEIEAERQKAVEDILAGNRFRLVEATALPGPYYVQMARREERLILEISSTAAFAATDKPSPPHRVSLHMAPLRGTIRDYFTVCESYFEAGSLARPGRLEAIDAGRKALHDEGAQVLRDRLADKIEIDQDTARRLFTLICVLHI